MQIERIDILSVDEYYSSNAKSKTSFMVFT
jgi:hypothetical protein